MKQKKLLILFDIIGPTCKIMAKYLTEKIVPQPKVVLARFSDLVFVAGENPTVLVNNFDIRDFSLVCIRRADHSLFSLAGTLALYLDNFGVKYFDTSFREIGAAGDKFTSLSKLAFAKIPVPTSMFLWRDKLSEKAPLVVEKLGMPLIAKEFASQRNSAIFFLRNRSDFEKIKLVEVKGRPAQFLFEPYLKIVKEYRLLVLGNRVAVAHTKAMRNYEGFKVVDETPDDNLTFLPPEKISTELKKIAVTAARVLNIEIAGVDICEDAGGQIYVLEVNRGPGFIHDPKRSPELLELAHYFTQELKDTNDY